MKELKFIHITKCAGSYIEDLGKLNNIDWGRFHLEYGWHHKIFKHQKEKLKKKYDWFIIVRNPYERILSEYYCKWGGIGKKKIKHNLNEFNEYLINKIVNRKQKRGGHYTEQYKYIDENVTQHIIKLETMDNYLPYLFKEYDHSIKFNNISPVNQAKEKQYSINDFNVRLITLINNVYDKDFDLFSYDRINPTTLINNV